MKRKIIVTWGLCSLLIVGIHFLHPAMGKQESSSYKDLPSTTKEENPLQGLDENFYANDSFETNLPIVTLDLDGEFPNYKKFKGGNETVLSDQAYVSGVMNVYDTKATNRITSSPTLSTPIKAKIRGHMTYDLAKKQYRIQTLNKQGEESDVNLLGLGSGHSWIFGGSITDKSLIRNYIAYRIASLTRVGAPDSTFAEVFFKENGKYKYQGVYLVSESIGRGKDRVNISNSKNSSTVTSYIVRRDRYTNFDPMLETYARLQGIDEEWIGVKYPSEEKLTEDQKKYIEDDFSQIEKVIYSNDKSVFQTYSRYIDVDSFVDYFLINEYFGNYDAMNHSVYMYKDTGSKLKVGPVWDFNQAMNNYYAEDMAPSITAFQTAPFYKALMNDPYFVDALKKRYNELRKTILNDDAINEIIEQATSYLTNAKERELSRWHDYYFDTNNNIKDNYIYAAGKIGEYASTRRTQSYNDELTVIRSYLHTHGDSINAHLTALRKDAKIPTGVKAEMGLFLFVAMVLFIVPTIMVLKGR